jgi:hypothetical protein
LCFNVIGGGKVAMLAGSHSELFTGISIVHPAMLDVKDVDALAVPLALYPSKVCLFALVSQMVLMLWIG